MPIELSRYQEQPKQTNMAASRNSSGLKNALLLLSLYLNPMSFIIFTSVTAPTSPFQHQATNRMRQRDVGQNYYGVDFKGWASPSPSASAASKAPLKTFLRLSAVPIPSDSQATQQNGSPGSARDMTTLSEWSRACEIVLADGVELTEDLFGDWSLTTKKSIEQGSYIMTVPAKVILTSSIEGDSYPPYYSETDMKNVRQWMEKELESGPQAKQDYLPEYMLVYKLLREVHMGTNSRWYSWLQSLPTQFANGLFLDEVERTHVERMTGDYIKVQALQYQSCLELFQKFVSTQESKGKDSVISAEFLEWMLELQRNDSNEDASFDNLVKWAFSIVFTRSWRSPDRKQAQIVPLGDLANHDSQFANLKPSFRETDGAFQFFVASDIDVSGSASPKLYLSYGLTYAPARFLVIFGFCDVTAAYIDANLDFLQPNDDDEWPTHLEPSQLVVSTLNGALSEEVWIAFLYKILQKHEPDVLSQIREVFDEDEDRGDKLIERLLEEREFDVGMEIQAYYQNLLETDFKPIEVTDKDLVEHPNLSMVVNYNLFMRETYLSVLEHLVVFLTQCSEFQKLSASNAPNQLKKGTSIRQEPSILHFQSDSTNQVNQDSATSKNTTTSRAPENKTKEILGELDLSGSGLNNSTDFKIDSTSKTTKDKSTSTQKLEESKGSEKKSSASLGSTEMKREEPSYSKQNENKVSSSTSQESSISGSSQNNSIPPFSGQEKTPKDSSDKNEDNNVLSKNKNFRENPQESFEIGGAKSNSFASRSRQQQLYNVPTGREQGKSTTPLTLKNDPNAQKDFSPNTKSSLSAESSDQRVEFPEQSQEMADSNKTPENNDIKTGQPPYSQAEILQEGANTNATSRFTFENFNLRSYSNNLSSGDVDQKASQNIPTGDFDPQYYAASLKERRGQDWATTPTSLYGNVDSSLNENVDSQQYPDGASFFPDEDSNFFPDEESSNFFLDPDSSQESTAEFLYGNTNCESYSVAQFDYGNSNLQPYPNGETTVSQEMIDFQHYSDSQIVPTEEELGSGETAQNDYQNANSKAYFTAESAQMNGIDQSLTPAFPNDVDGNMDFPNGQTEERIHSTYGEMQERNGPAEISEDLNEGAMQQQVGAAFVTSYTESLVSDQRGDSQQQEPGTESFKQETNRGSSPSAPTTYAEYMQQRQQEE